jgi:hypothetical protein
VAGTGDALDGRDRRDSDLDTLAWMLPLQQGQVMASQQPEIARGGSILSHPAERGRHLVHASGSQS